MEAIDWEFIQDLVYFLELGGRIKGARRALELVQLLPDLPEEKHKEDFPANSIEALEVAERFKKHGLIQSANLLRDWFNLGLKVEELVPDLQRRIKHELESVFWLYVPSERGDYYMGVKGFGEEVASAFPSAAYDIEEAGKSLALGRFTASVFHLMRVLEVGLRALGKSLNDPSLDPRTNPSWDRILGKCDKELSLPISQRNPTWRADNSFFSTATANLRAVKDAWRNPTMHVEKKYTEEEAREIFDSSRAFMRHLATKLTE